MYVCVCVLAHTYIHIYDQNNLGLEQNYKIRAHSSDHIQHFTLLKTYIYILLHNFDIEV